MAASLPTGCSSSDFPGPNLTASAGSGFTGCVTGVSNVLLTCCARLGGTPAFVDNTCGCPFGAGFTADAEESFGDCTLESNATATCYLNGSGSGQSPTSGKTSSARKPVGRPVSDKFRVPFNFHMQFRLEIDEFGLEVDGPSLASMALFWTLPLGLAAGMMV
ncbi:hypothetical protein FB451DRAFT_1186970 [Mycena latifolia]|nr:hypothetical protein FB451DRAFT_1186970 [Mycena latifolia]